MNTELKSIPQEAFAIPEDECIETSADDIRDFAAKAQVSLHKL